MSKFKVGQKIVFYDAGYRYKGHVTHANKRGTTITAKGLDGNVFTLHTKQCRKLKPKAKPRKFRGEWKKVFENQTMPGQQMAFVPFEPFVDLQSLEGKDDYLIQTKGAL